MRTPLLLLFITLCLSTFVHAQDTVVDSLDRKGKVWLDGSAHLNAPVDQLRAGYFFTDRLLVGASLAVIGDDDTYVSPFVRYYLNGAEHKWRPYGEAGLQLGLKYFEAESKHAALGVERVFDATTLLNLELRYTNFRRGNQSYSARGSLNTLLGGIAWKKAAQQHFRAGSLVLGNQLFEAGISSSDFFAYNYLNLTPSVDYFLTDRLAVQGSLNLGYTSFDQQALASDQDYTSLSAGLRGGARYYLTTRCLFNVFLEGGLTYEGRHLNTQTRTGNEKFTTNELRADLGLGTSVFINRNTSLDFGLQVKQDLLNEGALYFDGFLRLKFWFN